MTHTSISPSSFTHILTTSALDLAFDVSIVTACLDTCLFINLVRSRLGLLILQIQITLQPNCFFRFFIWRNIYIYTALV